MEGSTHEVSQMEGSTHEMSQREGSTCAYEGKAEKEVGSINNVDCPI